MESKNNTLISEALKTGAILGLITITVSLIVNIIDISLFLAGPWWFPSLYFLSVNFIFWALITIYFGREYVNSRGGYFNYSKAYTFSLIVAVVDTIIKTFFGIIFMLYIDPDFTENLRLVVIDNTTEMLEKFNLGQEAIDLALQEIENQPDPLALKTQITNLFVSLLGCALFSLLFAIFIKKNPPVSDRIN